MEWVVKLEARSGWGEVETIEVATIKRRVVGLTAEEVGLTLAEGKDLLGELGRLVLQTQMEEYTTCARVCPACMKLRRQRDFRTRKIQTIFGTITVEAPRRWNSALSSPVAIIVQEASPIHFSITTIPAP